MLNILDFLSRQLAMDPNQALTDARAALAKFRQFSTEHKKLAAAEDLAEAFEALDEWLKKDGLLPDSWSHPASNYVEDDIFDEISEKY